jgi:hypothetical protein
MTRHTPLWQQASAYSAAYDRGLIATLYPLGGASGARPSPVANSMSWNIPVGRCAVPLSDGTCQLCVWDAVEQVVTAAAPPSGQSRIDLIVCTARDNALDGGGNNDFIFQTVTGVPAASAPATPATPANSYRLGVYTVPGAVANLNGVLFNDARIPLGPGTGIHGRWARGAAFSMASGGNIVQFDTAVDDPFALLWSTWGGLIIPVAGRWAIAANVSGVPPGAGQALSIAARINQTAQYARTMHASFVWGLGVNISFMHRFAAADLLDIFCSSSGATWTGQAGTINTWLTADYLGP